MTGNQQFTMICMPDRSFCSDGQEYLVILTADHIMQGFDETEIMRRVINRATGIPPNNIFINFSHTHNSIFPGGRWKKEAQASTAKLDIPYDEWLGSEGKALDPICSVVVWPSR